MNLEKFPTGIGEQATRRRGILEGFWSPNKVVASVSHKGVISNQPQSAKKNRSHQVDTCRKTSNRDNSGNRNSSVPQPKVESSRH